MNQNNVSQNNADNEKILLHLVIGGEMKNINEKKFKNCNNIDIVGVFPNYKYAYDAWKEKSQKYVDNANIRYFIVHIHKLLDPNETE